MSKIELPIDGAGLLDVLVEEYEEKYPEIFYASKKSSRAKKAAEIVKARQIHYLGFFNDTQSNVWRVSGYTVRLEFDHCTCKSHLRSPLIDGRHLCKHRVALEMVLRLRDEIVSSLTDTMANTGVESITLWPRVYFAYSEEPQDNILDRMRIGTCQTIEMDPFYISNYDLHLALYAAGWHVESRIGGGDIGSREEWRLEPGLIDDADERASTGIERLDGIALNVAEDRHNEAGVRMLFDPEYALTVQPERTDFV